MPRVDRSKSRTSLPDVGTREAPVYEPERLTWPELRSGAWLLPAEEREAFMARLEPAIAPDPGAFAARGTSKAILAATGLAVAVDSRARPDDDLSILATDRLKAMQEAADRLVGVQDSSSPLRSPQEPRVATPPSSRPSAAHEALWRQEKGVGSNNGRRSQTYVGRRERHIRKRALDLGVSIAVAAKLIGARGPQPGHRAASTGTTPTS